MSDPAPNVEALDEFRRHREARRRAFRDGRGQDADPLELAKERTGLPIAGVLRCREDTFDLLLTLGGTEPTRVPLGDSSGVLDARKFERAVANRTGLVPVERIAPKDWHVVARALLAVAEVEEAGGGATAPTPPSARPAYPDNEAMQVSHETIYRSLYIQARGTLKRELTRHLRTRRQKRYARSQSSKGQRQGKVTEMVMISERPPEVEDRAVPGHWEGDLLMGNRQSAAAIATLVERSTRYCQLVALPEGTEAERVCEALAQSITTLPTQLRRSLTWDQGHEMSLHRRFSVKTGVDVYFCDPRSPWQRGSNENTNGLLRQYFPKGESLAGITQERLDEVAELLNGRPRKTLGFRTPAEKLTELIEGLAEAGAER